MPKIPEILIDNLVMTRNVHKAELFAFAILPNHLHLIIRPGEKGLSAFMHSFKRNSSWQIQRMFSSVAKVHEIPSFVAEVHEPPLREEGVMIENICWQKGFFDERIRDNTQRSHALKYVRYNAWHHRLCATPDGWPWTSQNFEALLDPMEIWPD